MIDFRKLEAFCKVYEQGSFSRAGEALFLSQPTISAHVQALEKEIGAKLLDRLGRTVLPTPAGTVLYRYGLKIFAELEAARNEVCRLMGDMVGELGLGASTIPASFLLPGLVVRFVEKYPQVIFRLVVKDSLAVIREVLDGQLMLGVVGAFTKHPDLEFFPIVDDELILVARPGQSFISKRKKSYNIDEITAWPWIMREEGSGTRKAFEEGLFSAGFSLRALKIVLDVDSTQAALQYTLSGLGVTVTSGMAAHRHLERGELEALKVNGLSLARKFYVVRNPRRALLPAAAEFVSFIHKKTAELRKSET